MVAGHPTEKAKAEFIQTSLKFGASVMIGPHKERLEITDCLVRPVQIANFMLLVPNKYQGNHRPFAEQVEDSAEDILIERQSHPG